MLRHNNIADELQLEAGKRFIAQRPAPVQWASSSHLAFFGLDEDPFVLTPDRKFFFNAAGHTAILEVLRYGLAQGEGFLIVIGEVGTGKTMLLRMLISDLRNEYETALVLSPLLSPADLIRAILVDVGYPAALLADNSIEQLLRTLNTYLFELASQQKRLAVIIDEAQNLPEETIEQLRLLSNFESDQQKLLQIILVGQPELHEKIHSAGLRQLLQRITIMEQLPPLTRKETTQYIEFRLRQAGRDDMEFGWNTRHLIWKKTGGVPRLINKIMGRALLVAYSRHSQKLTGSIIKEAAQSLTMPAVAAKRRRQRLVRLIFLLLLLAGSLLFLLPQRPLADISNDLVRILKNL